VGQVFPVRHFSEAMQAGFIGTEFQWSDVLVVALWGVAGLVLAARFFSWEPRR
jgi:ABC-2 type transport system permease protein